MVLIQIQPNFTNKFSNLHYYCSFIEFHYHLYISHMSPNDGPSGLKYGVTEIIRTFVCVRVTSPFLFVSTINVMQHYKTNNQQFTEKL
jgi:hypothetical protein